MLSHGTHRISTASHAASRAAGAGMKIYSCNVILQLCSRLPAPIAEDFLDIDTRPLKHY